MRSIVFLGITLLAASVGIGQNHPSLPAGRYVPLQGEERHAEFLCGLAG
jgi:hypothetical protein